MKAKAAALKNKITNAVGSVLAAPTVSKHNVESIRANRRYQVARKYNDMKRSGVMDDRTRVQMDMVRDYYGRNNK